MEEILKQHAGQQHFVECRDQNQFVSPAKREFSGNHPSLVTFQGRDKMSSSSLLLLHTSPTAIQKGECPRREKLEECACESQSESTHTGSVVTTCVVTRGARGRGARRARREASLARASRGAGSAAAPEQPPQYRSPPLTTNGLIRLGGDIVLGRLLQVLLRRRSAARKLCLLPARQSGRQFQGSCFRRS